MYRDLGHGKPRFSSEWRLESVAWKTLRWVCRCKPQWTLILKRIFFTSLARNLGPPNLERTILCDNQGIFGFFVIHKDVTVGTKVTPAAWQRSFLCLVPNLWDRSCLSKTGCLSVNTLFFCLPTVTDIKVLTSRVFDVVKNDIGVAGSCLVLFTLIVKWLKCITWLFFFFFSSKGLNWLNSSNSHIVFWHISIALLNKGLEFLIIVVSQCR